MALLKIPGIRLLVSRPAEDGRQDGSTDTVTIPPLGKIRVHQQKRRPPRAGYAWGAGVASCLTIHAQLNGAAGLVQIFLGALFRLCSALRRRLLLTW